MSNICFFGLLYIKKNENSKLNFKSSTEEEKILVYLKNAIVLEQQLKKFGIKFELITNKKKYLNYLLNNLNSRLSLKKINFYTYVPKNTHFYSCHFRVDVFRYLSSLKNTYSILVDLDVLVLKSPLTLVKGINKNKAFVNDITNNVLPSYGKKKF